MTYGNYDLHRFKQAVKERKGELQYDLKRAQERVADIEREIAEATVAEARIQADIDATTNVKGTIE